MSQQLLLIGGGYAHFAVLDAIARKPLRDTEVTFVSRFEQNFYSGMLPGYVAGHYAREQCTIPLEPLAQRAGATFIRDRIVAIDLIERVAYGASGAPLPFDVVSIEIGSEIDKNAFPGLGEHAVRLRPIEKFIETWQRLDARFTGATQSGTITLIGGGAGGVELVLAMAHRVKTRPLGVHLQLITGGPGLLPAFPTGARRRFARLLPRLGVRVIEDDVVAVGADWMQLKRAGDLPTNVAIAAIGAAAAPWPKDCGLKCDERGFIAVNRHLQSLSHPFVFAAGDCATVIDDPRPKSGVYALRAGPPLTANLRRYLSGAPLKQHSPSSRALYLVSAGARCAIGTWGPFSVEGRRVWEWKDRIDRKFIARYNDAAPMR
jgi:selenide,water dikinase